MRGRKNPINLKKTYGGRFRIEKDECQDELIPHKWGHFWAYSNTEMACFICGNKKFLAIQREFPSIIITQHGDEEINFKFNPALFPKLAFKLKAKRKRVISAEHKQKLLDAGKAHRFSSQAVGSASRMPG